jgi:hypothetical protein
MDINSYLMNINRTIGENARYARQFQANQQNASVNTATPSTSPNGDALNSTILLLLFQLLGQLMTQNGYGLPSGSSAALTSNTNNSIGTSTNTITQNPAYTYLNTVFNQVQPSAIDFEDNSAIQKRLDDIFATNTDPTIQDLAYQIRSTAPDASTVPAMQNQLKTLLKADGWTDQNLTELDLLWQAQLVNHTLPLLEIQAAGMPSTELTNQMNTLKQNRSSIAAQWQTLNENNRLSRSNLASQLQAELQKGSFTETQLGSSLKYLLAEGPDASVDQIATLTSDLMESGDLNITSFLANDYLEKLTPERQQALLKAVEDSGFHKGNGKPNTRFIGFMLEALSKPGEPQTKAFLQQFLKDFYQRYKTDSTTPAGKLLSEILDLADIQEDANGQLIFP